MDNLSDALAQAKRFGAAWWQSKLMQRLHSCGGARRRLSATGNELSISHMSLEKQVRGEAVRPGFYPEWLALWRSFPMRWQVVALVAAWTALFQFLGHSTLGYVNTRSLFGWWFWVHTRGLEDAEGSVHWLRILDSEEFHAWLIPVVVLVLLWCRRDELVAMSKGVCWPALAVFVGGVLIHVLGYMVQQARISVIGFFVGLYGLTGLFWGAGWLRAALFPFALFAFCVPLGSSGDVITFPLRMLATRITSVVCDTLLGINVLQDGTRLFDAGGSYQYEVAPACSGIRSLTAIMAFGVIYGYVSFKTMWRRLLIAGAAFPLAVLANVFRLTLIVLAAEAFGQKAGNYVHESSLFSLAPYLPSIGGMLLLGWWLRENKERPVADEPVVIRGTEQKA
jgi:exosortase